MAANSVLFEPITIGELNLSNRLALAPLTRFRNSDSHAPKQPSAEYYSQRAQYEGTLLITEATFVDEKAGSYKVSRELRTLRVFASEADLSTLHRQNAPGIYTDEQIQGWKEVVDAGKLWFESIHPRNYVRKY